MSKEVDNLPGAWNPGKTAAFRAAFMEFLKVIRVDTKEFGTVALADMIFDSQRIVLDGLWDGLSNDVHSFAILKSRQLGISTITRALVVFWLGFFKGMRGALIFDTSQHTEEARVELESLIRSIPASAKFPTVVRSNRSMLELSNGSTIQFWSAGTRKGRGSGTLGRGSGINLVWASEMCSWDNDEGVKSLESSVAKEFENRLYIWESTARGMNIWYDMWNTAKQDELRWKTIFAGWWAHPLQRLKKGTPAFKKYAEAPLSELEKRRIREVKELYGYSISEEQLAWFRRQADPIGEGDGDHVEYVDDDLTKQDQPWVESEAFILSGSSFFPSEKINEALRVAQGAKYVGYKFYPGTEFIHCVGAWEKALTAKDIMLKVWEEPVPDAEYVVAWDPAFGHDEGNDRSALQVLRCYADKVEQVAEFANASTPTHQFAWAILSIVAWYKNCLMIGELNGPGEAVFKEIMDTIKFVKNGYLRAEAKGVGIADLFNNVKQFVYSRSDSMTQGAVWQWKCLALDTPLPTPTGWTTMGDVQVGDTLFDEMGRPCKVTMATPAMIGHDCYRLTFDGKVEIVADADHLWQTANGDIVPTTALIPGKSAVPMNKHLDTPDADLPIDPYVLGAWLGDGHSANGRISAHKDDVGEMAQALEACGYEVSPISQEKNRDTCYFNIVGLSAKLKALGLRGNKHIPQQYLRGSYRQRLALLQGLMDTDGTIALQPANQCVFFCSHEPLAKGFMELLHSLGIKFSWITRTAKYRDKYGQSTKPAYQIAFSSFTDLLVFRLARKRAKHESVDKSKGRVSKTSSRVVRAIEPVPTVPVKCIEVDSPSHLYLAGEAMIPTHNTTGQLKVLIFERLRDHVLSNKLEIRSIATLEEMRSITRNGDEIRGEGKAKDDRAFAMALATHGWTDRIRNKMSAQNRTKAAEVAKTQRSITDQIYLYNQNALDTFFKNKQRTRIAAQRATSRQGWRAR